MGLHAVLARETDKPWMETLAGEIVSPPHRRARRRFVTAF